jgi:hypothetical protein
MQRLLIGLLVAYKRWLSPLLPSACRFHPTCSVYAREAIEKHGVGRGCWLALKRIARCHPFHPGGLDPVPEPRTDDGASRRTEESSKRPMPAT